MVLDPLLFLMFINYIVDKIYSHIQLNADCILYSAVTCNADMFTFQSNLDNIDAW